MPSSAPKWLFPGEQLSCYQGNSTNQCYTALLADGPVIDPDKFFTNHSEDIAKLALFPTVFQYRKFAAAGGLMSYGDNLTDGYRLDGSYVARILMGQESADLPVQQPTKVELIINVKTAKAFGLTVPLSLLLLPVSRVTRSNTQNKMVTPLHACTRKYAYVAEQDFENVLSAVARAVKTSHARPDGQSGAPYDGTAFRAGACTRFLTWRSCRGTSA